MPFSLVPTHYDRSYIVLDKTFEKGGVPSAPAKAGQLYATRTNVCTTPCPILYNSMYSCYYNSIIESLSTNIKRIG